LENLGIDASEVLKRILNKYDAICRQDFSDSGWGPLVGCCKHGSEPNCSSMTPTNAPLIYKNKI
jgi:hypothetical protein